MTNIVVLRPSISVLIDHDLYKVFNQIFAPTADSVARLHRFLTEFDFKTKTGIGHLDDKWKYIGKKREYDATRAVDFAFSWRCNILGGVFLNYLSTFGIDVLKCLGMFSIDGADLEFYMTLYSGMQGYFDGSINPTSELGMFWQGVIYNNTGPFKVLEVSGDILELAYLKRVFREGLRQCIQSGVVVVDNAVHSPENLDELVVHTRMFLSRMK